MVDDDPFGFAGDAERTRLVPKPGPGARPAGPRAGQAEPGAASRLHETFDPTAGGNAVLAAATPLLVLLTRLFSTVSHPDPEALRRQVAEEIKAFSHYASGKGVNDNDVFVARYVLCTALDEAVLSTPWGGGSTWHRNNLLVTFHGEADGGDKFFTLLDRMNRDPGRNLPLLELMYVCLSLGFQGRYRVHPDGRNRLTDVREQLYQTIRRLRERSERELSPHWQAVSQRANPLVRHVPLWVIGALGVCLLFALFWIFSAVLSDRSDPVALQMSGIRGEEVVTRQAPGPSGVAMEPVTEPRIIQSLRELLADDIDRGQVEVYETPSHAVIRLHGDGLFDSGRSEVKRAFLGAMDRIAAALNEVAGPVLVAGHTDSVPIRTPRYPSNWHLSQARADAVMAMLAERSVLPDRLSAKGRAHNEPLVGNDTPANRARNRRVEVLIPKRPSGASGAAR